MAICGIYGVVEKLPLITGIDFAGVVDVAWSATGCSLELESVLLQGEL